MVGYCVVNIGNAYVIVWWRSPRKALFTGHTPGCAWQILYLEQDWSVDHMQVEKHLRESQTVSWKWRCFNGGCKTWSLKESLVSNAGKDLHDRWIHHRDNSWQPLGTPSLSLIYLLQMDCQKVICGTGLRYWTRFVVVQLKSMDICRGHRDKCDPGKTLYKSSFSRLRSDRLHTSV